ncbi:MAG: hypothetical protein LUO82_05435 [Methanomicrobiales archaeon]|nr:hypothetical protein [Methanomicrobiales archaeon]
MTSKVHLQGVLVIIPLVWLVGTAVAAGITAWPTELSTGEMVTIDITDLENGSTFSLLVEAVLTPPSTTFQFRASSFQMPLGLDGGVIDGYAENVVWARVAAKKGSTTVSVREERPDGIFQVSQDFSISPGTFEYLLIEGERREVSAPVLSRLQLTGTKQGPATSRITFIVDGIKSGTFTVRAYVNGTDVMNQVIRVVPRSTDEGQGGGGVILPEPPLTSLTPTILSTPLPGRVTPHTFTSVDGIVTVTASIEYLVILRIANQTAPTGWLLAMPPYQLVPETATFTAPAVITFNLSSLSIETPLFISLQERGDWRMLPSRIEGGQISADISRGGVYGVMTLASTISEEPIMTRVGEDDLIRPPASPLVAFPVLVTTGALVLFIALRFRQRGKRI